MRTSIFLSAAAISVLGSSVLAQPHNEFGIYSDETNAASRSGLSGASDGDVLVSVDATDFRYVGNSCDPAAGGPDILVNGFFAVVQDQDANTVEPFAFVICQDITGMPPADIAAVPDCLRTAPIALPQQAGAFAAAFSVTFLTPFTSATSACPTYDLTVNSFYMGIAVPANPAWTADGLTVHMSTFDGLGAPFGLTNDNPRAGAPNLTWARDNTNRTVSQPGSGRSHEIKLLTDAAVLNAGQDVWPAAQTGANPMFGQGGVYPDNCGLKGPGRSGTGARLSNGDGTAFRIQDTASTGGFAVVLFSGGFATTPVKPGAAINGTIPLALPLFELPGGPTPIAANPSGIGEAIFAPPYLAQGTVPCNAWGSAYFMAVTADAAMTKLTLSNGVRVDYQ